MKTEFFCLCPCFLSPLFDTFSLFISSTMPYVTPFVIRPFIYSYSSFLPSFLSLFPFLPSVRSSSSTYISFNFTLSFSFFLLFFSRLSSFSLFLSLLPVLSFSLLHSFSLFFVQLFFSLSSPFFLFLKFRSNPAS